MAVGCQRQGVTSEGEHPVVEDQVPLITTGVAEGAGLLASLAPATIGLSLAKAPQACGEGMVLVEGDYCPQVEQRCLQWMDPKGPYEFFRCAKYAPSVCKSKERRHLRFCIDREEYSEPGESLPANFRSWTHADKTCRSLGKRVCQESEWQFACEGEEMRPYPYGWERDASACNADHFDVVNPATGQLIDRRSPGDSHPRCESPFGVRHMAGNLEEFVTIDGTTPARPAMKGAYWQPSRNTCRAAQTAHDRYYNGMETGFRCCGEASTD